MNRRTFFAACAGAALGAAAAWKSPVAQGKLIWAYWVPNIHGVTLIGKRLGRLRPITERGSTTLVLKNGVTTAYPTFTAYIVGRTTLEATPPTFERPSE